LETTDSGPLADSGAADAGGTDTGAQDSGAAEEGPPETGGFETGVPETGTQDSGTPWEAGAPDTSVQDTGAPDTGMPPDNLCPLPQFAPAPGPVPSPTNVVITAPGLPSPPDGYICYTTDGTLPNSSNCRPYTAGDLGIPITESTTFHAISTTLGKTCVDSMIVVAPYAVAPPPPPEGGPPPVMPSLSKPTAGNNDYSAQISDATAGAIICYTFGTTAPTCARAACGSGSSTYGGPIPINAATPQTAEGQVEIQAIACAADIPSLVAYQIYTLQAATPSMSPAPGTWPSKTMGSFTDGTAGATVYYATDGSMPSCTPGGPVNAYSAPFPLTSGTYNAVACRAGYQPSSVAGPYAITVH
jgi:hypothetical protein